MQVTTLSHEDKCRYAAKLLKVGCDCPYTIQHEEYWCNGLDISDKMPLVTYIGWWWDLINNNSIITYLVYLTYYDKK